VRCIFSSIFFVGISLAHPMTACADTLFDYAYSNTHPWKGQCQVPKTKFLRWKGFPVVLCEYEDIGTKVSTYMLKADRSKIARWITTACVDAQEKNGKKCVDYLIKKITSASSMGVFPVAGYIPEPQDGGLCNLFRDGVTVTTYARPHQLPPVQGKCGPGGQDSQPILRARVYARIASTTRDEYREAGGREEVGADGNVRWLSVVRNLYQKAWNRPRNQLISAKAIAAKRLGKFR
jgi:hypothetical protein